MQEMDVIWRLLPIKGEYSVVMIDKYSNGNNAYLKLLEINDLDELNGIEVDSDHFIYVYDRKANIVQEIYC